MVETSTPVSSSIERFFTIHLYRNHDEWFRLFLMNVKQFEVAEIFFSSLISFVITYCSKRVRYAFQSSELGSKKSVIPREAIFVASFCVLGFVICYYRVKRAYTKCSTQLLYQNTMNLIILKKYKMVSVFT